MTDKAIELMNSCCDPDKVPAFQNGFWTITQEELDRFYAKAQAAALREAAEKFVDDPKPWQNPVEFLRRMAEEKEKK